MYKADGSLFVGNFKDGKANGEGYYFIFDGSFYHGKFENNKAVDSRGELMMEDDTEFVGDFKNNILDGKGVEKGDNYTYKGHFKRGKRTEGIL